MKKLKIAVISLVAILILSISIVFLPLTVAHDPPWTISTWAFLSVQPNPIGVGQNVYVSMWVDKEVPTSVGEWGARWHNFMVNVTKPDGETETLGPFDSDSVGGAWTTYMPTQIGTYEFVFSFPGQVVVEENPYPFPSPFPRGLEFVNDTFTGSTSEVVTLTVQEDQIETNYPANPFPEEYWERPINSMNREWSSLGGNWYGLRATTFGYSGMYSTNNGNFNPYTTAPNSAHVLWTKPIAFGGQIGGEFGSGNIELYATGTAYETKFSAVILYGILYYHEFPGAANNPGELKAVDLRTGEELWSKPLSSAEHTLTCGMVYNLITGNQYGGHAYIFTGNPAGFPIGFIAPTEPPIWSMHEAMTGDWILDIANVSVGTLDTGPNGELLSYRASGGMLTLWNASKCIEEASWSQNYVVYSPAETWRPPQGATIDWNGGIEWSVPVLPGLGISTISDDVILMTQSPGGRSRDNTGWRVDAGYSANTGELLWGPINRTVTEWAYIAVGPAAEGVYTMYNEPEMTWTGYDITTGEELWVTENPTDNPWTYYDRGNGVIGYGNLYQWTMGGEVFAYDIKTGDLKWEWSAGSAGIDTPYGVWPLGTFNSKHLLADGKIYVRAGHDYTPPVFKGAKLYCIDAYEGEEIWSSLSFSIVGSPVVAEGYMLWFNGYDNQIYCYGKGQSKTTVIGPEAVQPHGAQVLIKGKVTDESSGAKTTLLTSRFPSGVPAVSDEDQSAWMEYLYQQQPCPEDLSGVPVELRVVHPNGEVEWITTVTSDGYGNYAYVYTPPTEGIYKVIATFPGSESYWSSYCESAVAIGPATAPETPIEPEEPTEPEEPIVPLISTEIAIVVAFAIIAVVGIIAYWFMRKRQ